MSDAKNKTLALPHPDAVDREQQRQNLDEIARVAAPRKMELISGFPGNAQERTLYLVDDGGTKKLAIKISGTWFSVALA